jgi:GNAT superfamily N-acetyltransferase
MVVDRRRWLTAAVIAVHEIDPSDDDAFRAWYTALHAGASVGRAAPVVATFDALAASLRTPGPRLRRLPYAARDGGTTVGAMLFELPLTENTSVAQVEIDVPEPYRGRGVGTALWQAATDRAAAEGRTIFQTEVNVAAGQSLQTSPGGRFALRLGFVDQHVEDHLAMALPLPQDRLATLEESVPAEASAYEIVAWTGRCPDEHLEVYAAMRTAMERDVPIGELTREPAVWDAGRIRESEERASRTYRPVVSLARTTDGQPAGYTLAYVPHGDPDNLLQDDTYVVRAHRGRRLATMLKVRNLRQVEPYRAGRRWLHTWTADSNASMQAVNARFGFTAVERVHEMEKNA